MRISLTAVTVQQQAVCRQRSRRQRQRNQKPPAARAGPPSRASRRAQPGRPGPRTRTGGSPACRRPGHRGGRSHPNAPADDRRPDCPPGTASRLGGCYRHLTREHFQRVKPRLLGLARPSARGWFHSHGQLPPPRSSSERPLRLRKQFSAGLPECAAAPRRTGGAQPLPPAHFNRV